MADAIRTEVADSVAVITIDRPRGRNGVNGDVARGIAAAIEDFDSRGDVSVLVLTGAGGNFSAGMDLKAFLAGDAPMAAGRGFGGIVERPPGKPGIAAGEGYAPAGGVAPGLARDPGVARGEGQVGLPEGRGGPGGGGGRGGPRA